MTETSVRTGPADTAREERLLTPEQAAARLRALQAGGRGFLGTDPVTQNDALVARLLREPPALLMSWGQSLLGARPNLQNPRQAEIASTSGNAEALGSLLGLIGTNLRCESAWAICGPGEPALAALGKLGFRRVGLLRNHYYRSAAYLDATIHYRELEQR
jgi:hypothetical protein